ncbi:unnamed protein product [Heterobilharzia americana]|nr:unnamed protein product [Heterobilharzia americana]
MNLITPRLVRAATRDMNAQKDELSSEPECLRQGVLSKSGSRGASDKCLKVHHVFPSSQKCFVFGEVPAYLLDRTVKAEEVLKRLTPEDTKRLEFYMTEYRTMLEQGANVPKSLNQKNILDLLCCTSFTSRSNF